MFDLKQVIEEEEVKMLRKEMIPRAQLMPFFDRPFFPQRYYNYMKELREYLHNKIDNPSLVSIKFGVAHVNLSALAPIHGYILED